MDPDDLEAGTGMACDVECFAELLHASENIGPV